MKTWGGGGAEIRAPSVLSFEKLVTQGYYFDKYGNQFTMEVFYISSVKLLNE